MWCAFGSLGWSSVFSLWHNFQNDDRRAAQTISKVRLLEFVSHLPTMETTSLTNKQGTEHTWKILEDATTHPDRPAFWSWQASAWHRALAMIRGGGKTQDFLVNSCRMIRSVVQNQRIRTVEIQISLVRPCEYIDVWYLNMPQYTSMSIYHWCLLW
jgi:hypothetical protein